MKQFLVLRIIAACLCIPMLGSASAGRQNDCLKPLPGKFAVYDAMLHAGKADASALGMMPAYVLDRGFWADEATRRQVDYTKLRLQLSKLPAADALIVLDVEHFPLTGDGTEVAKSLSVLRRLADSSRTFGGGRKVGHYALLPISEYWRPINGLPGGGYSAWRNDNARIAPLARSIDVNLPSLYTFYPDRKGWVRQAEALVCEARRLSGKPVYAFIWPEYHDSTELAGQPVPPDYWRLQLQTLKRIADGVVIWGGYDLKNKRAYQWDNNAEWWKVTKQELLKQD